MNKTKIRKQLLADVLSVQTSSGKEYKMIGRVTQWCANYVPEANIVTKNNNIYITKGDSLVYPCVVAHTDTVHDIHDSFNVYDDNGCLFAFSSSKGGQVGVGGDDKVGIWIALEALLSQDVIKCVFFHSEEIGCVGSSQADMEWFKDVGYCLQADRRGNSDFVNNISGKLYSKRFSKDISPILKKYGYKETSGAITDVGQLAENEIGVSVANMSCGYYQPHTDNETVVFEDANNCLDMVEDIINTLGCNKYEFTFTADYYGYGNYNYKNYYKTYNSRLNESDNDWYDEHEEEAEVIKDDYGNETCYYCGNLNLRESTYGDEFRFCSDCNSDITRESKWLDERDVPLVETTEVIEPDEIIEDDPKKVNKIINKHWGKKKNKFNNSYKKSKKW